MTEKQWLEQSDKDKSYWLENEIGDTIKCGDCIDEKLVNKCSNCEYSLMNWQGFGMIVEKLWGKGHIVNMVLSGDELKPWEEIALEYGKMKGLIE